MKRCKIVEHESISKSMLDFVFTFCEFESLKHEVVRHLNSEFTIDIQLHSR